MEVKGRASEWFGREEDRTGRSERKESGGRAAKSDGRGNGREAVVDVDWGSSRQGGG